MPDNADKIQVVNNTEHEKHNRLSLEELPNVRICYSKNLPLESCYLTLSHRWGNPPSILLTKKSAFLLHGDITSRLLQSKESAVFRHAIHVTRYLGFRYLWIDALCIMQDDDMEKQEDVMHMDEIYFNSSLNISATEGTPDGLLFNRNLLSVNPCRTVAGHPGTHPKIGLQAFVDKCFLRGSDGPLNKRGWVFQELTLSPRIVHFTKEQVFWECHSLIVSEILPQGLPAEGSVPTKQNIFHGRHAASVQQVKQQWYNFVEQYSQTSLSFPDDRLLAISAIAKRCCSGMGLEPSEYLAGIWKGD